MDLAANGYEAIRMCEHLPFDIVFMDGQMPECDGYEATTKPCQSRSAATCSAR